MVVDAPSAKRHSPVEHPPKNAKWRSPLEYLQDGLGLLPRSLRSESRCVAPEHSSRPVGPSVSTQPGDRGSVPFCAVNRGHPALPPALAPSSWPRRRRRRRGHHQPPPPLAAPLAQPPLNLRIRDQPALQRRKPPNRPPCWRAAPTGYNGEPVPTYQRSAPDPRPHAVLPIHHMDQRHLGLTKPIADSYTEAAIVCLNRHHQSPTEFELHRSGSRSTATVDWLPPNPRARGAWANTTDATEQGAYACADDSET